MTKKDYQIKYFYFILFFYFFGQTNNQSNAPASKNQKANLGTRKGNVSLNIPFEKKNEKVYPYFIKISYSLYLLLNSHDFGIFLRQIFNLNDYVEQNDSL